MRKIKLIIISILVIATMTITVSALPEILDGFNNKYHTRGTRLDSCDTCHIPDKPKRLSCDEICHVPNKPEKIENKNSLNPYGLDIKNNLNLGISGALGAVENLDSDEDRFSNIDEIRNLTFPGSKNDFPKRDKNNFQILFWNFSTP
jgi:hypothetical protein